MKKVILIITFLLPFYCPFSYAQMPDWTLIIDKDGNRFYFDQNGKIWTSGNPEFDYKPVSIEGLDYYLNQGIELIKSHYKKNGLALLKSILALPEKNEIVYNAQIKASREIDRLLKTEGTRFEKLNKDASLLLYKENNSVILINDNMLYSIKTPLSIKIISNRVRSNLNYNYSGLLLGIRLNKESTETRNGFTKYDLLIAIDSERLPYKIKDVKHIETTWRKRLGHDTFKRIAVNKNDNEIVNSYKDTYVPNYSGFECFYIKNNYGYYLKTITGGEIFEKHKKEITEIVYSFKI
ncbi:MAG: hypothetical protein V1874_15980 [Spirochaetota bacterium]